MCGNFGLLLLDLAARGRIDELLATMLRVTMARGAQSAGPVWSRTETAAWVRASVWSMASGATCALC